MPLLRSFCRRFVLLKRGSVIIVPNFVKEILLTSKNYWVTPWYFVLNCTRVAIAPTNAPTIKITAMNACGSGRAIVSTNSNLFSWFLYFRKTASSSRNSPSFSYEKSLSLLTLFIFCLTKICVTKDSSSLQLTCVSVIYIICSEGIHG